MNFLNFDKAQTDYLKASLKTSHVGGGCPWFYAEDAEHKSVFLSDGHFLVVIPQQLCFVKSNGREISAETICHNMLPESELQQLTDTGLSTAVKGTKDLAHIFHHENGEDIWINEKYLKYFSGMTVRFMGQGMKRPVMVYWADTVVGMILPINHQ